VSIEIVLIPLALAAVGAWKARAESDGGGACVVQTRLRNSDILAQALTSLGAEVEVREGTILGRFGPSEVSFTAQADGSVLAHVVGCAADEAERLVLAVDDAYAAVVQATLYDRLVERAPGLGLRVTEESVDDDNAITLVLVTQSV